MLIRRALLIVGLVLTFGLFASVSHRVHSPSCQPQTYSVVSSASATTLAPR